MTHLYTFGDEKIFDVDFLEALSQVGIMKGDTIFVHSDISVFGKPVFGHGLFLTKLIEIFKSSVGESGTVVFPTFTYSFTKGDSYNPKTSRSVVGSLSEFFRKQNDTIRNLHPIFSVAASGRHANDFMNVSKDSFGENTAFDYLRKLDAKIIFFGVTFEVCTFVHHIEQMHKVPYRYIKKFTGTIIGEQPYEDVYTYFVRPLDGTVEGDFGLLELSLNVNGFLRNVRIGNGIISSVRVCDIYEKGMELLDANPRGLLKKQNI